MSNSNRMMALAINKSLLKEYNNRTVYMSDGDEFQIQLFNPETDTIGALIYINGVKMSDRHLVLRPGERIWLDRYIDEAKKLKFSTYEVENGDPAVLNAIKNNGEVKVMFYRKKKPYVFTHYDYNPAITYSHASPYYIGDKLYTYDNTADIKLSSVVDCSVQNLKQDNIQAAASSTCYYNTTANTTTANTIETGRVEKGNHSNQDFNAVDVDFDYWSFDTETVYILPKSRKPVYSNDMQKKFCPYCGRKLKQNFKFCPYCGSEV